MNSSEEEGQIKFYKRKISNNREFEYEMTDKIGEGTFGEVYIGIYKNKKYALKKMFYGNEKNGIPLTTLREIRILKKIRHENIITLVDIKRKGLILYIVFEYMKYDLNKLIEQRMFSILEIRNVIFQILKGIEYLHRIKYIHRDMKSSNILVDENLNIKIADFGLARTFNRDGYTPDLVTLWYRPPEMLFGSNNYSEKIDIWGIGCILGEMLVRVPIFKGKSEINQLEKIIQICGSINERTLPGVSLHPNFKKYNLPQAPNRLQTHFKEYDPVAVDLLSKLLIIDPNNRISSIEALNHDFFNREKFKRKSMEYLNNKKILNQRNID